MRVQWQTPSDDGGVGISNYTLTLTSDGGELIRMDTSNTTENFYHLNYTTNYSIAVTANNCIRNSYSTSLDILEGVLSLLQPCTLSTLSPHISPFPLFFRIPPPVGCGRPSAPVNGSIEEYRSTEEGALIQFHCDEGYTPSHWNNISSQCINSVWSPDPQLLHCTPEPYGNVVSRSKYFSPQYLEHCISNEHYIFSWYSPHH